MEEWKQRLKQARIDKGLSKTAFARLIPISNATATDWEKSVELGGIQEITGPNLVRVCEVLSVTPQWLLDGVGHDAPTATRQEGAAYQVPPGRFRNVPVYGKGFGGSPEGRAWTDGDFPPGASDKFAEIATSDPNAFLTEIEEGSMSPRYNPGEYALVEPNTVPELEDDVFVKLKNDGTCLKRLLSRRDGYVRLGSYNTTEVLTYKEEDIEWMYYVAHPVPRRKIKSRI